uniref:Uncharacterized protein n=1 Tax=Globodera pallida TaxID=36090 RepID=A0A183BHS0_GLOPA
MHLYRAIVQQQQQQSHYQNQRSLSPVMFAGNSPIPPGDSLLGMRRSSELSHDIDEPMSPMSLKAASPSSSR